MADLMIAAHCSPFVEGALGWAGSTTALMLFLAPLVTVRAILRDKTVGEYSPTPQLVHIADPAALHLPAGHSEHDVLARSL